MRFIFLSFVVCTFFGAVYASSDGWSVEDSSHQAGPLVPFSPTGEVGRQDESVRNPTLWPAQFEAQQYHAVMNHGRSERVYIPGYTPPPSYHEAMYALRGYIFVPGFTPSYQGGVCTTCILSCPRCEAKFSFTLKVTVHQPNIYFGRRGHIDENLRTPEPFYCPNSQCDTRLFVEGRAFATPFDDGRILRNNH